MDKFIYVFNSEARDALIRKGFKMLKEDNLNNIFVFENNSKLNFEGCDVSYILSNTLTF